MTKTATVYQQTRRTHWDGVAREIDSMSSWGNYYHKRIAQVYKFLVASGQRVIECGCATGDLLADLNPALGGRGRFFRRDAQACISTPS